MLNLVFGLVPLLRFTCRSKRDLALEDSCRPAAGQSPSVGILTAGNQGWKFAILDCVQSTLDSLVGSTRVGRA